LFKAVSYAEQVHALNHARALGNLKTTTENLVTAQAGEDFEIAEMYPVYNNTAKFQGEPSAELSTHYSLEAEKIHSRMYAAAKEISAQGKDIKIGDIYICSVCGHTGEGTPPDKCPICAAKKDQFVTFK
jgi:rubrerythrin